MKILLHTCCADCLINTVKYLKEKEFTKEELEIYSLFYNPNIHPRSEYYERLNAIKKVLPEDVKLIVLDYKPKEYFDTIGKKGKETRCDKCWRLRIGELFKYAKENDFETVSTTLLASNYQNNKEILKICREFEKEYGIKLVSITGECNCNNKGFYKQNYCGCCFSLVERMLEKESENETDNNK